MHEAVPDLLRPDDECPLCALWVVMYWEAFGTDEHSDRLAALEDRACWNRRADGVTTLQRRTDADQA
ncbi:MAG TPA: hypothetical protein VFU19_13480 [Iamia sp.]|nr:hypothetical protein [Iamia sp.]